MKVPFIGDKIKRKHGCVFGCVGTPVMDELIKWWKAGHKPGKAPECEWELIVWDGKVWVSYTNDRQFAVPLSLPCAIGSGTDFAMGALYCGASAKKAVEISAQLDTGTGGKIKTIAYRKD